MSSGDGGCERYFVITANKDQNEVNSLADRLGADVIRMDADKETCMSRVAADGRRENKEVFNNLIAAYFDNAALK